MAVIRCIQMGDFDRFLWRLGPAGEQSCLSFYFLCSSTRPREELRDKNRPKTHLNENK